MEAPGLAVHGDLVIPVGLMPGLPRTSAGLARAASAPPATPAPGSGTRTARNASRLPRKAGPLNGVPSGKTGGSGIGMEWPPGRARDMEFAIHPHGSLLSRSFMDREAKAAIAFPAPHGRSTTEGLLSNAQCPRRRRERRCRPGRPRKARSDGRGGMRKPQPFPASFYSPWRRLRAQSPPGQAMRGGQR
jgi:hypothetical protein